MRLPNTARFVCAAVLVVVGGCGSDALAPTLENIAGTYEATSFTAGTDNVLAAGGSLTLTLGVDLSVSGSLFVPASVGGPLTEDMAGTFVLSGNSLTLTQAADTFVRDADWTWEDGILEGSWSGGGGSVSVRLDRQ
jgi:hypothetical protein